MTALRIEGWCSGNCSFNSHVKSVPETWLGLGSSLPLVKGSTKKRWQGSQFKTLSLRKSAPCFQWPAVHSAGKMRYPDTSWFGSIGRERGDKREMISSWHSTRVVVEWPFIKKLTESVAWHPWKCCQPHFQESQRKGHKIVCWSLDNRTSLD